MYTHTSKDRLLMFVFCVANQIADPNIKQNVSSKFCNAVIEKCTIYL